MVTNLRVIYIDKGTYSAFNGMKVKFNYDASFPCFQKTSFN